MLGVALVVTVVGTDTTGRPDELGLLRDGWVLLAVCALLALAGAAVPTRCERQADRSTGSHPLATQPEREPTP